MDLNEMITLVLLLAFVGVGGFVQLRYRRSAPISKEATEHSVIVVWPKQYPRDKAAQMIDVLTNHIPVRIVEMQEGTPEGDAILERHFGKDKKGLPLLMFFVNGELNMFDEEYPFWDAIRRISDTVYGRDELYDK